mgnify:FL=1
MKYSELGEKEKNNCENILHVCEKVVSLQCQTKEIKNKTKTHTEMEKRYTIAETKRIFGEDAVKRLLAQDIVHTARCNGKYNEYCGARNVMTDLGLLKICYRVPWDAYASGENDLLQYAEVIDLYY